MRIRSSVVACLAVVGVAACADTTVGTVGGTEYALAKPPAQPQPHDDIDFDHDEKASLELPDDDQIVEPSHPAADTEAERSLVHVHNGAHVCSGVAVTPKLIATAHQCVAQDARGPVAGEGLRVEIPTSTLTWTERSVRQVVVPACSWKRADLAFLVLNEPVGELKALPQGTSPGPGGKVQALGYGRCSAAAAGTQRPAPILDVQSDAIVLDLGMCKGDVGGPVFDDANGSLIGIVSHQDDPTGSPRHTTTAMRLDNPLSRDLLAQAQSVADGTSAQSVTPIRCREARQ